MKKKPARQARPKAAASFQMLASLKSLPDIRNSIMAQSRTLGIPRDKIYRVLLAVEEACSNIIRHAYGGKRSRMPLNIDIETTRRRVCVQIQDVGKPFDFERYPSARVVRQSILRRSKGGYGIHLIKSLMDRCDYVRHDNGVNHLRLVKYIR